MEVNSDLIKRFQFDLAINVIDLRTPGLKVFSGNMDELKILINLLERFNFEDLTEGAEDYDCLGILSNNNLIGFDGGLVKMLNFKNLNLNRASFTIIEIPSYIKEYVKNGSRL